MGRSMARSRPGAALGLALVLSLAMLALLPAGAVRGASGFPSLTGHINGPSNVGVAQKASYKVYATGGPAFTANGSQVGILSFQASLVGLNTSSATVTPSAGVLVNGSITLSMVAPNLTESLTLYVDVVSNHTGGSIHNQTINLTYAIQIVRPITLSANLVVVGPGAVKAFALTVDLDGASVGTVAIPSLTAGQTYPINFSYVNPGLGSGWHTFSISLAQEHGLIVFSGGSESYSTSFYIPSHSNDNAYWYLAGAVAFGAVVFIWTSRVAARRRPKAKRSS